MPLAFCLSKLACVIEGARYESMEELNQRLIKAEFVLLKEKEIAFYYGGK
ncbi:hypothetical protein cce_1191 [Crocosphaera subtropica ATCC 51142]|uniref:Uncharacterized protein n=1 Tax=Crocosphaera subtropica (strain ATCC 51142 / BH68) TaxID=43989 RepID=B1WUU0_CROS5|nr:hypothetical protein cce_1191 [Crocosphaera subtropica ATCC 51142]